LKCSLFVGLDRDFFVSKANFLTALRSYLDVTCPYYFWFNLGMNLVVSFGFSYERAELDGSTVFLFETLNCTHVVECSFEWGQF